MATGRRRSKKPVGRRINPEQRDELWLSTVGFVPGTDAEVINGLRRLWGVNVREMAELTGISWQHLSAIATGRVGMGVSVLQRLFAAMESQEVTPEALQASLGAPVAVPEPPEPPRQAPAPRLPYENPERLRILALVEDWPDDQLDVLYRRVLGLQNGTAHG